MEVGFLLRGVIIGFSIAAPVGPIGVLCIRRTLAGGRLVGLLTGLGAASADAVYGGIAGFGLTLVSGFLLAQRAWLGLVGGLFLCYMGLNAFRSKPPEQAPSPHGRDLLGAYGSTFLLTLSNPMTILSFAAVFAGLGLAAAPGEYGSAVSLVTGVFLGSSLWWLVLSGVVSRFRSKVDVKGMRWVNRASGALIAGAGALAVLSLAVGR